MVDAWPVLTAVSFQPNSDGSEGKCQNVQFKNTLLCLFDLQSFKCISDLLLSVCLDPPRS